MIGRLKIPRDACPHCGESAGVATVDLLLLSYRKRTVACDACGKGTEVASETRFCSSLGMVTVGLIWTILLATRHPVLTGLLVILLLPAILSGGLLVAWATLRLVPSESGE
jgi:hypothetical protein